MMETKRALRLAQAVGEAVYIRDGYLYAWGSAGFLKAVVAESDIPVKERRSLAAMAQAGLPLEMATDSSRVAPERFPDIEGERGDVDSAALAHIVKHAAALEKELGPDILRYLWADGENVVCSDSRRLHAYRCPMPKCNFAPNRALAVIRPYAVTVGENFAVFEGGDATLWLSVCHDDAPDWLKYIEKDSAIPWLHLDVKRALATLNRAKVVAKKDGTELAHISDGKVTVGAWSEPLGEIIEPKGGPVTLNAFYLADALAGCDMNTATISWIGPEKPVVIKSGAWRAAIMPVLFSQYEK